MELYVTKACDGAFNWSTSVKTTVFLNYILEFISPTGDLVSESIDVFSH